MRPSFAALLLATLAVTPAAAQLPGQHPHQPGGHDPLAHLLFAPELVLQHAQDLDLQPAQRTTIVSAIKNAQGDLLDLQLQMADRSQELGKLIGEPKVDEAAALAAVDRVLALEREIKRKQLQLLIRIRNALTPEQHDKLKALHERMQHEHEQ
ncbi:MAG TPA: periplasmic heavy metal sensor [Gemmatimonadales bacterium]|nr:periplasmic heavy metal sensor [Gemmatimonadales bacterium]